MNHYLYAIVERLPAGWQPPSAGLAGAPVEPQRFDDLVVLSSLLDAVPAPCPRTLALHQDVVASVVDAAASLPLAYGTVVPAGELSDWLAGRRLAARAALQGVRGCVEMTVKLLRLGGASADQPAGRSAGRPATLPSGDLCQRELRDLAETLAERAALPDWRYQPSGHAGNLAAAVAFLVPRTEVAAFLARIAPVASHAVGVAVVPTGPWAPSSFVPELSRAPLARVPEGAPGPPARRAG